MRKTTLSCLMFLFGASALWAQTASQYIFSQSTETYVPVQGNLSAASGDDGNDNNIPIGFAFPFAGTYHTVFSISTNGFIKLGSGIAGNSWANMLNNANPHAPLIAPFWDDHNVGTGSIQYQVTGAAPNRILSIGWDQINPSGVGQTSTTQFGSFLLRLHETTGIIEMVYGPTLNAVNAFSASIGLNDATTFLSISPAPSNSLQSSTTTFTVGSSASVVGRKYTFSPGAACTSVSDPGNTIASSENVCANESVTLSLENNQQAFGYSYQWQFSTDGETFANIPDANANTLTTTQMVGTMYQCIVSCGAQSMTSDPVAVNQNELTDCYCIPTYNNGTSDGDLISNVVLTGTTLSNNSGVTIDGPSYTYYTGQPNYTATLQAGATYTLNVTVGTFGLQEIVVWIDYNDDGTFSDEERVGYTSEQIAANATGSFTITLDCEAPAGLHRMRIRDAYNTESDTMDPCDQYGYGETEDYDITIEESGGCSQPFAVAVDQFSSTTAIVTWGAGCGQVTWNVVVLPEGTPFTNENAYTNVSSPLVVSMLEPNTSYDVYVQGECGEGLLSDWTDAITFTTAPPAVPNDDCATAYELEPGGNFEENAMVATNAGATKTLGEPNVTCATFGFGGDVWFTVVVPDSGNVTVETGPAEGSELVDTGMSAYTGTCGGGLTSLGCNDDGGEGGFSKLSLAGLEAGTTIYVRVWEYANDVVGEFEVSAYDASLLSAGEWERSALKVYPNPTSGNVTVSRASGIDSVSVFNLLGQKMLSRNVSSTEIQIDLSALPTGHYLLQATSGKAVETVRLVRK